MAIPALTSSIPSIKPSTTSSAPAGATGFGDTLKTLLNTVEAKAGEANVAIGNMLDGTGDVHEAMIAMQKADTMLQLTVQVRNKLVQAYQDVMRMPV